MCTDSSAACGRRVVTYRARRSRRIFRGMGHRGWGAWIGVRRGILALTVWSQHCSSRPISVRTFIIQSGATCSVESRSTPSRQWEAIPLTFHDSTQPQCEAIETQQVYDRAYCVACRAPGLLGAGVRAGSNSCTAATPLVPANAAALAAPAPPTGAAFLAGARLGRSSLKAASAFSRSSASMRYRLGPPGVSTLVTLTDRRTASMGTAWHC